MVESGIFQISQIVQKLDLVKITRTTNFKEDNFWDINTQLTVMLPFSKLYNRDKTKDKRTSSLEMFCIFIVSDPDPEKNVFFRMPLNQRLSMIKETIYKGFNESDKLISLCIESYPTLCLSPVERALKEEIESMQDRAKLFKNNEYTLDETVLDPTTKKYYVKKGTAAQLDSMRAKTPKIYENYEKLEQKFLKQKQEGRIRGGRRRSKSEKKLG